MRRSRFTVNLMVQSWIMGAGRLPEPFTYGFLSLLLAALAVAILLDLLE